MLAGTLASGALYSFVGDTVTVSVGAQGHGGDRVEGNGGDRVEGHGGERVWGNGGDRF